MKADRIYIDRREDIDAVAVVLVRNGYTVRRFREKQKSGRYLVGLEYWKEAACGGTEGA